MANLRDFYFRQLVTDSELDGAFADLEKADQDLTASLGFIGVVAGAVISQHAPVPNLTVDVSGPGIVFDQTGRHIFFSPTQTVNLAADDRGVPTAVAAAGNVKIISVFVLFDRVLSDPRVDGNSQPVFFRHDEGFRFSIVQGAEAAANLAVPPPPRSDAVLLADVLLAQGQSQILNNTISTARRQDAVVLAQGGRTIRRGRINEALQDLLTLIGTLSDGLGGPGGSAMVGAPASAGLGAGTVRSQLDTLALSVQQAARPGVANVFTATQELDGPSDATVASLRTAANTGIRKLLWEVGNGAFALRFYVSNLVQFEWTVNARWNGAAWIPDRVDLDSGKLEFTAQGLTHRILPAGALATWDDTRWSGGVQLVGNPAALNVLDQNGTFTAPGLSETYAAYQGPAGGAGTTIAAGCSFKKRYPANPSSFGFFPVASSGVNNTFSAVNVTPVGMGVVATVNVATGAASFFLRIQVT